MAFAAVIAAAASMAWAPVARAAPTGLDVLTWSDEFEGSSLDLTKWAHRASGPRHDGVLTPDAVSVGDGVLTITTYTDNATHYSGMISTHKRGSEGFDQAYGYFEARVKFNSAPGQWSAFWLQSPTIGSPLGDPATAGVEMDIAEHRVRCMTAPAPTAPATCAPDSDISDRVQQALVWDGYGQDSKSSVRLSDPLAGLGNASWHTWALRWAPTQLTFYYDDVAIWSTTGPISSRSQYLILSSEVGRFFAGAIPATGYGSRESSTTNMQVDYVRAWAGPTAPVNGVAPEISGTPEVDQALACSPGSWAGDPAPGLSYEWIRDGLPITGASSSAYVLQSHDAGHELACRVTATNTAGSRSALSNALPIRSRLLAALPLPAPPPEPAAPARPAALDRTAPNARLSGGRHQKLGATVHVTIGCRQEACRAIATGSVRVPRLTRARAATYRLEAIMATIAEDAHVTVKLKLSGRARRAIRRALRARRRIVVKVDVRVADRAGNLRSLARRIALEL